MTAIVFCLSFCVAGLAVGYIWTAFIIRTIRRNDRKMAIKKYFESEQEMKNLIEQLPARAFSHSYVERKFGLSGFAAVILIEFGLDQGLLERTKRQPWQVKRT